MATEKIVGVTVRSGDYEKKPWKNLYISTSTTDEEDKGTVGVFSQNYKIQFKKLNEILSLGLSPDKLWELEAKDFQNLIGKKVKLYFDKFKNVDYMIILPDEKEPINNAK